MKRIARFALCLTLLLALALLLCACGGSGGGNNPPDNTHTHVWSEWTVTHEPRCNAWGRRVQTCECGDETVEDLEPIDHLEKTVKGTEPSCVSDGKTDGAVCEYCNVTLKEQQPIPAKGHTYRSNKCSECSHVLYYYSDGLQFERDGDGNYVLVGLGSCTDTEIYIPNTYNGAAVVGISGRLSDGFSNTHAVTAIILSEYITRIEDGAFRGFTNLKYIVLSDALTSIGVHAFNGCSQLASVTVGNSLTTIGASAFANCSSLTDFFIPESVSEVGEGAFDGCTSLTVSITLFEIPAGWQLESVNISLGHLHNACEPEIIKESTCRTTGIAVYLCECGLKTEAELPTIPHPEKVVEGYDATCTATGLSDGVVCSVCGTVLEPQKETPVLPHTEMVVEGYASTCTDAGLSDGAVCSVCSFVITEQLPTPAGHKYENGICVGCGESEGSQGLKFELASDGKSYVVYGIGDCLDTDIIIPSSHEGLPVTMIGGDAFMDNTFIETVTIPEGITEIGSRAFYRCTALKSVSLPSTLKTIGTSAFRYSTIRSLDIPDSVTTLGRYCFYQCRRLYEVRIGNGVSKIDDYTFAYCSSLRRVIIGSGVTERGYSMFDYSNNIIEVYNYSPTHTGLFFNNPSDKYDAYTDATPSRITLDPQGLVWYDSDDGMKLVGYIGSESELVLPDIGRNYVIDDYAFYKLDGALTSLTLSTGITEIGEHAFEDIYSLTSLNMPEGALWRIGYSAFYGCMGVTSLVIPEGVTKIEGGAFSSMSALTEISIPTSIEIIEGAFDYVGGYPAFEFPVYSGCYYLPNKDNPYFYLIQPVDKATVTTVEIHPDTRFIGDSAFASCKMLTEVRVPEGVKRIGSYAFQYCDVLGAIYIPASVEYIGSFAVRQCPKLTVYIAGSADVATGWSSLWNDDNRKVVWDHKITE